MCQWDVVRRLESFTMLAVERETLIFHLLTSPTWTVGRQIVGMSQTALAALVTDPAFRESYRRYYCETRREAVRLLIQAALEVVELLLIDDLGDDLAERMDIAAEEINWINTGVANLAIIDQREGIRVAWMSAL